ncbi:MAG: hypothetical protein CL678_15150 [Bdellovibrionaceae bacterium]|nr:hypothetical protein [Pseudobdellovibrionaceae bacterium]|tara:strand:+ start:1483 stop:2295 length:813 start_codon:yes stop_codon:yes gene_type:complete
MSKPINVHVGSLDPDYLEITWEMTTSQFDVYIYEFTILRSESPQGPFEQVGGPLKDQYVFRDYVAPLRGSLRTLYYKVRSADTRNQAFEESEPVTPDPRPPLDALEIIRLENVLLREYTGRPCALYTIRTFGQRCPDCYDPITQRRTRSSCITCYNTGYARGFFTPIMVYLQIDPFIKAQQNTQQFVSEQAQTQARMGVYPKVKPRDVIVERENVRWRVVAVRTTERLRAPVRQELTLVKIPKGDIEFKIPIDWPSVETSPRSFNTRMDL